MLEWVARLFVQFFNLFFMAKTYLKPINLPEQVSIKIEGKKLLFKGKMGEMSLSVHPNVQIVNEGSSLQFSPNDKLPETQAITGTMRALTMNFIEGVSSGFEKKLEINGVGYRAKLTGNNIELNLGYSHQINYELPEGVSAELPSQTEIVLKSMDKQMVGQVAAEIRKLRPPEPYKGKGIRYFNEQIRRKESKKA